MKREWSFLIFNVTEAELKRIDSLRDDPFVSYGVYCAYRTNNDYFFVGFMQFILGYEWPGDLFPERVWLKHCDDQEKAFSYIKHFPCYTEFGKLNASLDDLVLMD